MYASTTYQPETRLNIFLSLVLEFIDWISERVSFRYFKKGFYLFLISLLKRSLTRNLDKWHIFYLGLQQVVEKELSETQSKQLLTQMKKTKEEFIKVISILDDVKYFGDKDFKEICHRSYFSFAKFERTLRKKAYSGQSNKPMPKDYITALSNKSKETLSEILYNN